MSGYISTLAPTMPALLRSSRRIGTIIPDVAIEETLTDRMTITQHPIADGASVSDHAYRMPTTITMRVGWTNANPMNPSFIADPFGAFTETRARDIYQQLLKLMEDREPFDVVTGKRTHKDMLITELSVRTDHTMENVLIVECNLQEVFRVTTSTTQQPAIASQGLGPQTADTTNEPTKQATPASPTNISALHQFTGWTAPRQYVVPPP